MEASAPGVVGLTGMGLEGVSLRIMARVADWWGPDILLAATSAMAEGRVPLRTWRR